MKSFGIRASQQVRRAFVAGGARQLLKGGSTCPGSAAVLCQEFGVEQPGSQALE